MKNLKAWVAAAVIAFAPMTSHAGLPVIDFTNIVQNTLTALSTVSQYAQMVESYSTQIEELREAAEQVDALTGHSGFGDLLNDITHREARRYTPTTWRDTMQILEAGGLPGSVSDVLAIYDALNEQYDIAGADEFNRHDDEAPNAQAFERRRDTNFATFSVSEESYDQTTQRFTNLESLMGEIENTDDMKAISDLNARISGQNGTALAELIRLQAVMLQNTAATQNQELVDSTNMKRMTQFQNFAIGEIPTE